MRLLKSRRGLCRVLAVSAIAGLLALLLVSCSGAGSPSPARANVPQTVQVTVAPARQQDLPIYLTGLGSVTAFYTVGVKSRVDGQLIDVKFREGEFVRSEEHTSELQS